jgi:hypothetical protein
MKPLGRTSAASEPHERSGDQRGPRERVCRGVRPPSRRRRFGEPRRSFSGGGRGKAPRILTTAAFVVIGGSASLLACPVCFGAHETSIVEGTRIGVLVMLAITLAVQGAFVGFFLYLRKRAKRIADIELDAEWSKLQRSPRTS